MNTNGPLERTLRELHGTVGVCAQGPEDRCVEDSGDFRELRRGGTRRVCLSARQFGLDKRGQHPRPDSSLGCVVEHGAQRRRRLLRLAARETKQRQTRLRPPS